MTTSAATIGRASGLIAPTRSTAYSESGLRLAALQERVRQHLLQSYAVRVRSEDVIRELDEVRSEASAAGWNGYDAQPIQAGAYRRARVFLQALPTTVPIPEVSVDADGEVALDWIFAARKALTVSIGSNGRCTFAWVEGLSTFRGTAWIDDSGIPVPIAEAVSRLARQTGVNVGL